MKTVTSTLLKTLLFVITLVFVPIFAGKQEHVATGEKHKKTRLHAPQKKRALPKKILNKRSKNHRLSHKILNVLKKSKKPSDKPKRTPKIKRRVQHPKRHGNGKRGRGNISKVKKVLRRLKEASFHTPSSLPHTPPKTPETNLSETEAAPNDSKMPRTQEQLNRELMDAIAHDGSDEQIRGLIKAGADINSVVLSHRIEPLTNIVLFSKLPLLYYSIACTPIILAASQGNETCVKLLISLGADVNKCVNGFSPLFVAINEKSTLCAKILIEGGAALDIPVAVCEIPTTGRLYTLTPLMLAVLQGNEACVTLLLEHGAFVDQPNSFDLTALMHTTMQHSTSIIKIAQKLLDAGASPDLCGINMFDFPPRPIKTVELTRNTSRLATLALKKEKNVHLKLMLQEWKNKIKEVIALLQSRATEDDACAIPGNYKTIHDDYKLVGLDEKSTCTQIEKALRHYMLEHHADKNRTHVAEADEHTSLINAAFTNIKHIRQCRRQSGRTDTET